MIRGSGEGEEDVNTESETASLSARLFAKLMPLILKTTVDAADAASATRSTL